MRDCLRAILAEVEKPGVEREETLEKIKVAANGRTGAPQQDFGCQ
jgi:hypothetical protein